MVEPKRTYPQGSLASQLLGTVGTDNYGLSGLEQLFDKQLRGTDGKRRVVRDALGDPVSIVDVKRAEPGHDVKLTLDATLQERVEAVLADVGQTYRPTGATALVMDPRSGAILALANWPRVDANDISGAPAYARQNRAVAAAYEPGSTFKAITVSGALQDKLVTPDTTFDVPPQIQVADRTIKDAEDHGYETLSVARGQDRHAPGPDPLRPLRARLRLRQAHRRRPARRVARHRAAPEAVLRLVDGQPADRPGHRGHADPDGTGVQRHRQWRRRAPPVRRPGR
jgi:cell division protein FtsI/penicillin-binding protein 2